MMRILHFSSEERGSALVVVALWLTVFLGMAALVFDIGSGYAIKAKLQNAADAAALAGAKEMPSASDAINVALEYAQENGMKATANGVKQSGDTVTVTAPSGGNTQIKVECSRDINYSFAKVLGFNNGVVRASAVAKKELEWAGEALPFINLDDDYYDADYSTAPNPGIVAWEKVEPGKFESIWPSEYHIYNADDPPHTYFTLDWDNGIMITDGTVATIKQEVGYVYDQHQPVYIFSLNRNVFSKYKNILKNKSIVPVSDLVLLQVTFDSYDYSGKTLFLTVQRVYDINAGDLPIDYLHTGDGPSHLVK
ncbi:MAG: pilus assembly protein TadG-related protein [Syntrophomonadaceae bacterium]